MIFILDFGSGNTCKNDFGYIRKMINQLADIDRKRKFIIKWQLFKEAGENTPLDKNIFHEAYRYAQKLGYQTTASVFDLDNLNLLLAYNIPFIKIANNIDLFCKIVPHIPRKYPVFASLDLFTNDTRTDKFLCCVSKYPAKMQDYTELFSEEQLQSGNISDHTTNWDLFKTYSPKIYECHYKLEDSTGLDSGNFARTPKQLEEIYDLI